MAEMDFREVFEKHPKSMENKIATMLNLAAHKAQFFQPGLYAKMFRFIREFVFLN